jgi:hypothetical protein
MVKKNQDDVNKKIKQVYLYEYEDESSSEEEEEPIKKYSQRKVKISKPESKKIQIKGEPKLKKVVKRVMSQAQIENLARGREKMAANRAKKK